jgi:hypothetical protein
MRRTCDCCRPEDPVTKPEECTPEQIEECHGQAAEHLCAQPSKERRCRGDRSP